MIDIDAANVDYKNQWVTQAEWDALATAITAAQDTMSTATTDQQVTDEAYALKTPTAIFNSAKKQGTFLDKTTLTAAIASAQTEMRRILIDTDATNVDYKNQWVTQAEWDMLAAAITAAQDAMSTVAIDQHVADGFYETGQSFSLSEEIRGHGEVINVQLPQASRHIL